MSSPPVARSPAGAPGRRTTTLAVGLVSAAAFVALTVVASRTEPFGWELRVFARINGLPGWLYVVLWPFMQYGVFVTIPIAATIALLARRRGLAAMMLASGIAIYLGAKVVKGYVDRGRPNAFLSEVVEREHFAPSSLGYTSGHAAVAATIATLSWFHLPRALRWASLAMVVIVSFGRTYVGAHLPLDLLGGVAMGVAAGSLVTWAFGADGSGRGGDPTTGVVGAAATITDAMVAPTDDRADPPTDRRADQRGAGK